MMVVFDLDYTLVDRYGTSVRPGVEDLLQHLAVAGHGLALWTAASRYRTENIFAFHDLGRHFDPIVCRDDPLSVQAGGRKDIRRIGGRFLVDDESDQIEYVRGLGLDGFLVAPYSGDPLADEDELDRLLDAIVATEQRNG